MAVFTVSHLTFTYPECSAPVLRDVSLTVRSGEFVVLCGATGSGKSTLLRMLKPELTPLGTLQGEVLFHDAPLTSDRRTAAAVGFVMQQPEQQIVTDKVWHELAFGCENLGLPPEEIARRCAETASWLGIGELYERETAALSGGQKQLLNLAAVLTMQPEILILDEPTAQLDPIAAQEFMAALRRLHEELGMTILIAEHRLEELVPICDRLLVMEEGSLLCNGTPETVIEALRTRPELLCAMPAAARLWAELPCGDVCPLTVRDGRQFLGKHFDDRIRALPPEPEPPEREPALEFRDVCFRYTRQGEDVLRSLSVKIGRGEIFCILGGNGSGKSTTLAAAAGLLRPYSGSIRIFGKQIRTYKNQSLYRECLAMLPQDVQTVFLMNTVREELAECGADVSALPFDLSGVMDKHPYDLSGGQQQMAALAKVLAAKPKLLLLDEPTKGMDAAAKQQFITVLRRLQDGGMTVVIVSHDVEFAAACADRCALCFNGQIVSVGAPRRFFSGSMCYTTAVSRMTRGLYEGAVLLPDVLELCRSNGRKDS